MKQMAREIENKKRAQGAVGGKSYGSATGISSSMYSSSTNDNKPDITPTPVTYSTNSPPYVSMIDSRNKDELIELDSLSSLDLQIARLVKQALE